LNSQLGRAQFVVGSRTIVALGGGLEAGKEAAEFATVIEYRW